MTFANILPLSGIQDTPDLQSTLNTLPHDELVALWRKIHKRYPPARLGTTFIKRSIVYEWQCWRYGAVPRQVLADIKHTLATDNPRK